MYPMAQDCTPARMIRSPITEASPAPAPSRYMIRKNVPITATVVPSHQYACGQRRSTSAVNKPVNTGIWAMMSPAWAAVVIPMPTLSKVGQIAKFVIPETKSRRRSREPGGNGRRRLSASASAMGPARMGRRTPMVAGSIPTMAILLAIGVPPQRRTAKAVTPQTMAMGALRCCLAGSSTPHPRENVDLMNVGYENSARVEARAGPTVTEWARLCRMTEISSDYRPSRGPNWVKWRHRLVSPRWGREQ